MHTCRRGWPNLIYILSPDSGDAMLDDARMLKPNSLRQTRGGSIASRGRRMVAQSTATRSFRGIAPKASWRRSLSLGRPRSTFHRLVTEGVDQIAVRNVARPSLSYRGDVIVGN